MHTAYISPDPTTAIVQPSGYITRGTVPTSPKEALFTFSGSEPSSSSDDGDSDSDSDSDWEVKGDYEFLEASQTSLATSVLAGIQSLNGTRMGWLAMELAKNANRSVLEVLRGALVDNEKRLKADHNTEKSFQACAWNDRFQKAIMELKDRGQLYDERIRIYRELADLAQDFIHSAKTYGKIIISEVYVGSERKTISPLSLGGIAGGDKYMVNGILFKFAVDSAGLLGSDEAASKVAGHDLKGLIAYFNLGIPDLYFPLMALVDYLGFRLIAMSLLPINSSTIVYGTADAGKNIHAKHAELNQKMKYSATKLNLKPHVAGFMEERSRKVWSAADVEGHVGHDGKLYLLDFSRTFPPRKPDRSHQNSHLYFLLRPEFVKNYPKPLCSDAYSGFVHMHNGDEHTQEIDEATDYLLSEVIPRFADQLRSMDQAAREGLSVKEAMHMEGINLHYLGIVRRHLAGGMKDGDGGGLDDLDDELADELLSVERGGTESGGDEDDEHSVDSHRSGSSSNRASSSKSDSGSVSKGKSKQQDKDKQQDRDRQQEPVRVSSISELFLIEMLSRTVKHNVRRQMRQRLKELKVPLAAPFRQQLIEYLNLVFGNTAASNKYWNGELKHELLRNFPKALLPAEKAKSFNFRHVLGGHGLCQLFASVLSITSLRFRDKCVRNFSSNPQAWSFAVPFDTTDLEEMTASVKHMNIMALAEGYVLKNKGRTMRPRGDTSASGQAAGRTTTSDNSLRLCEMAMEKFREALNANPGDKKALRELADTASMLNNHESANMYYQRCIEADPEDANSMFKYAVFLDEVAKNPELAEEYYLRTLEKDPLHDHCLQRYADFLESQGWYDDSEQFYLRAAECRMTRLERQALATSSGHSHKDGIFSF